MLRLHRPEAKNPLAVTSLASGGFERCQIGLYASVQLIIEAIWFN